MRLSLGAPFLFFWRGSASRRNLAERIRRFEISRGKMRHTARGNENFASFGACAILRGDAAEPARRRGRESFPAFFLRPQSEMRGGNRNCGDLFRLPYDSKTHGIITALGVSALSAKCRPARSRSRIPRTSPYRIRLFSAFSAVCGHNFGIGPIP